MAVSVDQHLPWKSSIVKIARDFLPGTVLHGQVAVQTTARYLGWRQRMNEAVRPPDMEHLEGPGKTRTHCVYHRAFYSIAYSRAMNPSTSKHCVFKSLAKSDGISCWLSLAKRAMAWPSLPGE
jgi:hypothetical protein